MPASATQNLQTLWEDPQQWFPAAIEQPTTTFLCCCCEAPLVKFCRCRYTRRLLAQHTRTCRDQCLSEQAALPSSCHPSRDCVSPSSHAGAQEGGWTQPASVPAPTTSTGRELDTANVSTSTAQLSPSCTTGPANQQQDSTIRIRACASAFPGGRLGHVVPSVSRSRQLQQLPCFGGSKCSSCGVAAQSAATACVSLTRMSGWSGAQAWNGSWCTLV